MCPVRLSYQKQKIKKNKHKNQNKRKKKERKKVQQTFSASQQWSLRGHSFPFQNEMHLMKKLDCAY